MPMLCVHRSQYDKERAGTHTCAAHLLLKRPCSRAETRAVLVHSGMSEGLPEPRDVQLSAGEGIKFLTSPLTPQQKQQAAPELSGMSP